MAGIKSAWSSLVDSIEYALSPLHFTTLHFRLEYVNRVILTRNYGNSLLTLRQLLRECDEKCCGLEDIRSLEVRLYLACCLAKASNGHCEEAIVVAAEIIDTTLRPGFPSGWVHWYQIEAHFNIAFSQKKLGQEELSEKNMREAIRISAAGFGAQDAQTLTYLSIFESWLRHWGRIEAADEIRKQWKMGMGLNPDDEDSDVINEEDWKMSEDEKSDLGDEEDWDLSDDGEEMDIER